MEIFYTYILLDPTQPGQYSYNSLSFLYKPFYVGKGKNNRCYNHLRLKGNNMYKKSIIRNILSLGKEPIIVKIKENISDQIAQELEITLISEIGRRDLNKGHLSNLTDGGDGWSGYKMLQCQKDLISKNNHWKGQKIPKKVLEKRIKGRLEKGSGRKKLYQYSFDDFKLLKIHESVRIAACELDLRETGIAKAAREQRHYKGFIWSYVELKEKPLIKGRGCNLQNLSEESKKKRDLKRKETWAKKKINKL